MGYEERLKALRKALGKTQQEFGDMLDMKQVRLSRWENGAFSEEVEKLNILKAHGVSMDWLISGEGEMFSGNNYSDTIKIRYPDLSAAAGPGALNFEELSADSYVEISRKLVDLSPAELKECFMIKVRGRSMMPEIEHGDQLLVRSISDLPEHAEGVYLVRYDNELYVKNIHYDRRRLVMQSLNKEFAPIIIEDKEDSDIKAQILGKVVLVIKQF
ncbi:MAG: XRE family transcriptional regulator [Brevinema sp.]